MSQIEHKTRDYKRVGNASKEQRYKNVMEQLEERLDKNAHPLSTTSNLLCLLKQQFNWWWVGYYWLVRNQQPQYLALGQCQGPAACAKLYKGKGVCGTVWATKQTIILEDVHKFEGHIACTSVTKSEMVIPIEFQGEVVGVLDIDGAQYGQFDTEDEKWVKILLGKIEELGHFEWFAKNI